MSKVTEEQQPDQRNRVLDALLGPGHPVMVSLSAVGTVIAAVVIVVMLANSPDVSVGDGIAAVFVGAAAAVSLIGAVATFSGRRGR
ncbi:hypothetical protein ACFP2T_13605 [Plantactinospora solaniradicis]|uniref:Uncharacterized protein n=1 Tax=Plantactinospora solaniradicis TaxID=1723736 RepID=A0ABW1K8R9_9ACTN